MIGVFVFVAIYLFYMIYTNIILIMFMKRLTPTLLTEDEAKEKNLHVLLGEDSDKKDSSENKKDIEKNPKVEDGKTKEPSSEKGKKIISLV